MDRCHFRSIIAQKSLFDLPAASYQLPPLARRKCSISPHLLFNVMSDRQVDIVAAEDEVLSHRDAMKQDGAIAGGPHANESEIGCSSTHIANQNLLPRLDAFVPIRLLRIDPRIKRRLR